jgi:CxxC motif-containing protein (DUF1111 family)
MGNNKTVRYVFSAVVLTTAILFLLRLATHNDVWGQTTTAALDPGVRVGGTSTGSPLASLAQSQLLFFQDGRTRFQAIDSVRGTVPGETDSGLGPAYNSTSCGSCHAQPATGGSSPVSNPQFTAAFDDGATNTIPSFIAQDGPVREARFPFRMNVAGTAVTSVGDGGVHDLFTITGRTDAPGCQQSQPNFVQAIALNNIIFRIPTPLFGAGLIENIPEATIYANLHANQRLKASLGITGHTNNSGNDGTITRFGWKAQNKSVLMFAGEAYNVEMGVTNELFTDERDHSTASCLFNATPEDSTNFPATGASGQMLLSNSGTGILSDIEAFANFIRFLAPAVPSSTGIPNNPSAESLANGQASFSNVGCALCHTPMLQTGTSSFSAGLNKVAAGLYSDLAVHHMGIGLGDNVPQGTAAGDEFRSAPLWGLGQRLFFLHDGRATPANGGLLTAIQAHSSTGSEANQVINNFNQMTAQQQQDLLNFLRSL